MSPYFFYRRDEEKRVRDVLGEDEKLVGKNLWINHWALNFSGSYISYLWHRTDYSKTQWLRTTPLLHIVLWVRNLGKAQWDDSSPLYMASPGTAHLGLKHPKWPHFCVWGLRCLLECLSFPHGLFLQQDSLGFFTYWLSLERKVSV